MKTSDNPPPEESSIPQRQDTPSLESLKLKAKSQGGDCIARSVSNWRTPVAFTCGIHEFHLSPYAVMVRDRWCPECWKKSKKLKVVKRTIDDAKLLAARNEGTCESEILDNTHAKLKWRCKLNHNFEMSYSNVTGGHWCPECWRNRAGKTRKLTIEKMKEFAKKKGGECLSDEYLGCGKKLRWRCQLGHEWEAQPSQVVREKGGTWCPICAPTRRITIERCREIAISHEGECLSTSCENVQSIIRWRCKNKHEWETAAKYVVSAKHWCPECVKSTRANPLRGTIEIAQAVGKSFGITCTSKVYKDNETPLEWKCSRDHTWESTVQYVKKWKGCKRCAVENNALEQCAAMARKFHGDCKSIVPGNTGGWWIWQWIWRCEKGHEWQSTYAEVKRGKWCLQCATSKYSDMDVIKKLTQPPKKREINLERIKQIAKERGGECLSESINLADFVIRCSDNHEFSISASHLVKGAWCRKCGANKGFKQYEKRLDKLNEIAEAHEGRCLSEEYKNVNIKMEWRCKLGHIWEAPAKSIIRGYWCPKCSSSIPKPTGFGNLSDVQAIARKRGGECLSPTYMGAKVHLRFRCDKGHEWETCPSNIKSGTWCPICNKVGKKPPHTCTLDEMREIAISRGGKCISEKYENSKMPLIWECKAGHRWSSIPSVIKRGAWCPACYMIDNRGKKRKKKDKQAELGEAREIIVMRGGEIVEELNHEKQLHFRCGKGHDWSTSYKQIVFYGRWCPQCARENTADAKKKDLQDIIEFARTKGGDCLSREYTDNTTKMEWKCERGHVWFTSWSSIQQGSWCPECRKRTLLEMQELARSRGGECLSTEYVSMRHELHWRCSRGHEWNVRPSNILYEGTWCPDCARKYKQKIEDVIDWQTDAGIRCVSKEFIHQTSPLRWQCKNGHIWSRSAADARVSNLCPLCSNKARISSCNEIIFGRHFIILSPTIYENLTSIITSIEESKLKATLDDHYCIELNHVVDSIKGRGGLLIVCTTYAGFTSTEEFWSIFKDCITGLEKVLTNDQELIERTNKAYLSIKSQLREIHGRDTGVAAEAIILHQFPNISPDIIDKACPREAFEKKQIRFFNRSCIMTTSLANEVITAIQRETREFDELQQAARSIYGDNLTLLLQHARGIELSYSLGITNQLHVDLETLVTFDHREKDVVITGNDALPTSFYNEIINSWKKFCSSVNFIGGMDGATTFARIVASKYPILRPATVCNYLRGQNYPATYDSLDDLPSDAATWLSSAIIAESGLIHPAKASTTKILIGNMNPLVFFDDLIPQIHHPANDSKNRTLSPAFLDYVATRSKWRMDTPLIPFKNITERERDLFLAALFDTHGIIFKRSEGGNGGTSVRILIVIPVDAVNDWLSIFPDPLPLDVSENVNLTDETSRRFQPMIRIDGPTHAVIHIFGRKFPEELYGTEQSSAEHLAKAVKYFYERVFIHCVHPRLDELLEASWYLEDDYGEAPSSSTYAKTLKQSLKNLGGIDTRGIMETVNHPIKDPANGKAMIFAPLWLRDALKERNITIEHLVKSRELFGGFVPRKYEDVFR